MKPTLTSAILAFVSALGAPGLAAAPSPTVRPLTLVVPASSNGSWHATAEGLAAALLESGGVSAVEIQNHPGGGGVAGLVDFCNRGSSDQLLVAGMTLVGTAHVENSPWSLLDTTPLARLASEPMAVVVSGDSPIASFPHLLQIARDAPESLTWVGSVYGSADHILASRLVQTAGIDPARSNYVSFSPGGSAVLALATSERAVAIRSAGEIHNGDLTGGSVSILALSSSGPRGGVAPTFREAGLALDEENWRGVFGAPRLSVDDAARLGVILRRALETHSWRETLARRGWNPAHLDRAAFAAFLAAEDARIRRVLGPGGGRPTLGPRAMRPVPRRSWLGLVPALSQTAGLLLLLTVAAAGVLLLRSRRSNRAGTLGGEADRLAGPLQPIGDLATSIERTFDGWRLTEAERAVAWLALKGLPYREVAAVRGTSERTVKHQAQSVLRKAGLSNRTELLAYFMEDALADLTPRSA